MGLTKEERQFDILTDNFVLDSRQKCLDETRFSLSFAI